MKIKKSRMLFLLRVPFNCKATCTWPPEVTASENEDAIEPVPVDGHPCHTLLSSQTPVEENPCPNDSKTAAVITCGPVPRKFFSNNQAFSFSLVICMLLVLWQVCLSALISFTRTFYPVCLFQYVRMQTPNTDGKSWQLLVAMGLGSLHPPWHLCSDCFSTWNSSLLTCGHASCALCKGDSIHPYFPRVISVCGPFVSLFSQLIPFGCKVLLRAHFFSQLFFHSWYHTLRSTLTPALSHGPHLPPKSQVLTPQTP